MQSAMWRPACRLRQTTRLPIHCRAEPRSRQRLGDREKPATKWRQASRRRDSGSERGLHFRASHHAPDSDCGQPQHRHREHRSRQHETG